MDVPDYYDAVSVRLIKVLDRVGLTEKIRWKRIEMWTQVEELLTIIYSKDKVMAHIFGSQAEATTTSGLRSDIDIVCHLIPITVIEDLQFWEPGPVVYLMFIDNITPPGYVKLQKVYNAIPFPIYNPHLDGIMLDITGRSCIPSNIINNMMGAAAEYAEYHGPALTFKDCSDAINSYDMVIALQSYAWPYTASEWITRHREHNWPSQKTIVSIQQSGIFIVPVGHTLNPERHLEWRISFSYGEKILVWKFNSTQYKCYVVLKMINKYYINKRFGKNVLTSYHWKTCMFYMIETTPTVLWQPQNLLRCIELCLMKMCTWIDESNCPNYFIPAENMFLGKVNGPVQRHLFKMLHNLIRQKGRYLAMIPCDGIGQKLNIACQSPMTHIKYEMKEITKNMCLVVDLILLGMHTVWFNILRDGFQIISLLFGRTHSYAARRDIYTILQRFYCSNLGSHLASHCLKQQTIDQEGLDVAYEFLMLGSTSDVASGKLKITNNYLLQNNVILAENILQTIEDNYTFLVPNVAVEETKEHTILRILNENISTTDVIRYYSAFSVPYLPSEMYCTPIALIPEMFRSTGSQHVSINPDEDYWQSWAVVDPKLYFYFLQHQCYHQQNKITHKMVALSNMIWVIRHEQLQYKDTALNVLAYCLKEDGFLIQSYAVLSKSMKLKNHHNAAKWQIARLVNAAFRWLGGRHYHEVINWLQSFKSYP
ncbi:hypothetical protein ACJMK2_009784 [Sinanodonta woodiana]|uniref:Mab-21-like HhH/H2TH-like domain-containing protein n=1 Tax=Sinanodonta woodiana TaxID=1069815 RepID=A0ABD3VFN1_SINWO